MKELKNVKKKSAQNQDFYLNLFVNFDNSKT